MGRRSAIVAFAALAGCAGTDPVASPACEPHPGGDATVFWRDSAGRAVIYRGVNVDNAAKRTADYLPLAGAADFARIAGWGLTSIRLLTFWQAIEPEPGRYDANYLAALRRVVDRAATAGLEVILDMHQDVYGAGFRHTGFPRWACDEDLYATYEAPSEWFLGYFEPEVIECFDRFWESDALQADYADAVAELIRRVGVHPAVTGIEIINEPYWGSWPSSRFEEQALQPLYARVATRLDDVSSRVSSPAPALRILAEPAVSYNFGFGTGFAVPFGCPTFVFAPHYYPLHSKTGTYSGDITPIRDRFAEIAKDAAALGAPVALTEFGSASGPGSVQYLRDLLTVADEIHASTWQWEYGPGGGSSLIDSDGAVKPEAGAIIRPYAHRVAGDLVSQTWDPATATLVVVWNETDVRDAPTEIVVPEATFPAGVTIASTDPEGTWSETIAGNRLRVSADPTQGQHTITITAP